MSRIASRNEQTRNRSADLDTWLARASHLAQVLLVGFGVFGYFYTVRPIHQKEVLDEEIAQKRIEVRDKEKQVAILADDIRSKAKELANKEKLLATARSDATAARSEAKGTYSELRIQLLGGISAELARCAHASMDRQLDGTELKECPAQVEKQAEYLLEKLKPADRTLIVRLIRNGAVQAQSAFDAVVSKQKQRIEASEAEATALRKLLDDAKPKAGERPNRPLENELKAVFRLDALKGENRRIRYDSYREFAELLERVADKVRDKFLAAPSA